MVYPGRRNVLTPGTDGAANPGEEAGETACRPASQSCAADRDCMSASFPRLPTFGRRTERGRAPGQRSPAFWRNPEPCVSASVPVCPPEKRAHRLQARRGVSPKMVAPCGRGSRCLWGGPRTALGGWGALWQSLPFPHFLSDVTLTPC